ncbi:hypothetical protein HKX48_000573 [Thoreauomyces humboldtii]|nr:hypothetical protein HKX48_000573 [Thoreauomyces humboldtii]
MVVSGLCQHGVMTISRLHGRSRKFAAMMAVAPSPPRSRSAVLLPAELITKIISFTDAPPTRYVCLQVSRLWYRATVPILWRSIAPRSFLALERIADHVATSEKGGGRLFLDFSQTLISLMERLDLTRIVRFDADPYNALARILPQATNLKEANLANCLWLTDRIALPLIACPHLRILDVHGCASLTERMLDAPELFQNLETLNIGYCSGMTRLAAKLETLGCKALKHIDMRSLKIEDMDASLRVVLRRWSHSLLSLSLEGLARDVTDGAFHSVTPILLPALERLDLRLCSSVSEAALHNLELPTLLHLSIPGCKSIAPEGLSSLSLPNLIALDVSFSPILSDESLLALTIAFPRLESLTLHGQTGLTTAGIILAAAAWPRLETLILTSQWMGSAQAVQLFEACPRLRDVGQESPLALPCPLHEVARRVDLAGRNTRRERNWRKDLLAELEVAECGT